MERRRVVDFKNFNLKIILCCNILGGILLLCIMWLSSTGVKSKDSFYKLRSAEECNREYFSQFNHRIYRKMCVLEKVHPSIHLHMWKCVLLKFRSPVYRVRHIKGTFLRDFLPLVLTNQNNPG
jgi:hypothetical protein